MDRRLKKTKAAIHSAYFKARKLNAEKKPSVKEICAFADINKTTFYRHYSDIDMLIKSIISEIVYNLLVKEIKTESLLTAPEQFFAAVVERCKPYNEDFKIMFRDYPTLFISEAEEIVKARLIETADKKYDDILLGFIAGGAVRFFAENNFYDDNNLKKFCKIVKAAVSAV